MTIHFMGTETDALNSSLGMTNTAGRFRTPQSRAATLGSIASPASVPDLTPFGTNDPDGYWIRYTCYYNGTSFPWGADYDHLRVYDENGNTSMRMYSHFDGAGSRYDYLVVYNTSNTAGTTSFGEMGQNVLYDFAFHVYTSGGNAVCDMYIGGSYVRHAVVAGANRGFKSCSFGNVEGTDVGISEVIVADQDIVLARVYTNVINGAGTETDWSGSYTDLAALQVDDAGIISTTTGDIATFTHNGSYSVDANVAAVAVSGRMASGSSDIQACLRIGGTNYFSPDLGAGPLSSPKQYIWTASPATAVGFTGSEVNGLELGFKAVA